MVYRKLLALPGLKLTHAAIDRDIIEKLTSLVTLSQG